jgi:hypothetical protein
MKPMWACPRCDRTFANRNQSHSCGRYGLEEHFAGSSPEVVQIFERVAAMIRSIGPVDILVEKTRIAFHVRMSFAAVTLRRKWLDGHVVLARPLDSPRFLRIDTISERNHLHAFRFHSVPEVDDEVMAWLREAYGVGEQRHLGGSNDARG